MLLPRLLLALDCASSSAICLNTSHRLMHFCSRYISFGFAPSFGFTLDEKALS
jgi:hypothetical protein